MKQLEETVDSSFHFEGRGDSITVIFAKKGYAPRIIPPGREDNGDLIRRDYRIVLKKLTPEEVAESVFGEIDSWRYNDDIVRYKGEKLPTTEGQLERVRKKHGLEKSDMTDLFVKAIQDYLSGKETNPENQTLQDRRNYFIAMRHLPYYPPPQQQFLDLIRKTVELEPESELKRDLVNTLFTAYRKAYPDAEPPDAK